MQAVSTTPVYSTRSFKKGDPISVNVMLSYVSIMFIEMIVHIYAAHFNANLVGYTICPTKTEKNMNPFQNLWMLRIVYITSSDGDLGKHKQYLVETITGYTIGQVFINHAMSKHCGPAYSKPRETYINDARLADVLAKFPGFGYASASNSVLYDHLRTAIPFVQGHVDPSIVDIQISDTNCISTVSFGTTDTVPIWSDTFTVGQTFLVNDNGVATPVVTNALPAFVHM